MVKFWLKLSERAGAYAMELKTEKFKVMANSTSNISASVAMKGGPLEEVSSFKYFRPTVSKQKRIRIVTVTTAISKLERI